MEPLFEGLTESEIQYLQYLQERGYFDGLEMFMNLDTSSDYRFDKFVENGYITNDGPGEYPGSCKITVTGKGIAAIVDYERYQNQIQPLNSEISALNQIAESLKRQTLLAENNANSASQKAKNSKIIALISIVITVVLGIVEIIIPLIFG